MDACDACDVRLTSQARSVLLVKGTTAELEAGAQRLLKEAVLDERLAPWGDRIKVLVDSGEEPEIRRGWDPQDPWDNVEARERGYRYWQLGSERVAGWLRDPTTAPSHLLLGIPLRGQTVVRYAWEIDLDGQWEYFPEWSLWGVPLGKRDRDHELLGKCSTRPGTGSEFR